MRIADAFTVLREDGPRWLGWRLWYEVQLRRGFVRSLPPIADVGVPLAHELDLPAAELDHWLFRTWQEQGGAFFFQCEEAAELRSLIGDREAVISLAERTLKGEFRYFSSEWRTLGNPPDWFQGVKPGSRWPSDKHWSRLADLSPELGDIKYVWEPSRFGFVFGLVRAWAATGDQRYPEAFWLLVEDWLDSNQPELGPHWRCAQEMSLRAMAWTFGLYAFRDCPSSTRARVARLIKNVWYHAVHVEKLNWYAVECVRNNHAVSEAVGLFTVGTLFPFLPGAKRWQLHGKEGLARELSWQIYEDGAYVQHSMNYARFVVQLCTWAIRLADVNKVSLPETVGSSAKRLLHFMVALQDQATGRVPNYGSNDGALIFPLTTCGYLDYRPALGALSQAVGEGRLYATGPWDEEAAWFCGPALLAKNPEAATIEKRSTAFPQGGYFVLRGTQTHGMIRCATYRHRPAQADMLHLDAWYFGRNVLVDPGTYSYNAQPSWSGHFAGTASHNTVVVNGTDQMRKGSRFMWHNWTKSRVLSSIESGGCTLFAGEHSAYAPVTHRRTVLLENETYLILDELRGGSVEDRYRLHWLLNDFPLDQLPDGAVIKVPGHEDSPLRVAVLLHQDERIDVVRAREDGEPRGWQSLHYGQKSPAWSMELVRTGSDCTFVTLLGPQAQVRSLLALGQEGLIRQIRNHPSSLDGQAF